MPCRLLLTVALGAALSIFGGVALPKPKLIYGPVIGDLTASTAVVWCRVEGLERVTCELRPVTAEAGEPVFSRTQHTRPQRSCGATFGVSGLQAATEYGITIPELSNRVLLRFRTMPAPTADAAPLRMAFSADVGGQHIGRDVAQGFAGFTTIAAHSPDVFIGLGDMVYADKHVPTHGRLGNLQIPISN